MKFHKDSAVSSVMSEMLLIALVLILVPTVTINLIQQMPEERVPTVNIMMTPIDSSGTVSFYHKGGDWIKKEDIQIMQDGSRKDSWKDIYHNRTYDLGDVITVSDVESGKPISFIVKNSVLFSGVAHQ